MCQAKLCLSNRKYHTLNLINPQHQHQKDMAEQFLLEKMEEYIGVRRFFPTPPRGIHPSAKIHIYMNLQN